MIFKQYNRIFVYAISMMGYLFGLGWAYLYRITQQYLAPLIVYCRKYFQMLSLFFFLQSGQMFVLFLNICLGLSYWLSNLYSLNKTSFAGLFLVECVTKFFLHSFFFFFFFKVEIQTTNILQIYIQTYKNKRTHYESSLSLIFLLVFFFRFLVGTSIKSTLI